MKLASLTRAALLVSAVALLPATTAGLAAVDSRSGMQFGKLAAMDVPADGALDIAHAATGFADLFWLMMWIGLGCAAIAMLASPWLRRAMRAAD